MTIGDNSIKASQLRRYVLSVEELNAQIAELNTHKKEIFARARSEGYETGIMKMVIAERKRAPSERAERDSLFDAYWRAVESPPPIEPATVTVQITEAASAPPAASTQDPFSEDVF